MVSSSDRESLTLISTPGCAWCTQSLKVGLGKNDPNAEAYAFAKSLGQAKLDVELFAIWRKLTNVTEVVT